VGGFRGSYAMMHGGSFARGGWNHGWNRGWAGRRFGWGGVGGGWGGVGGWGGYGGWGYPYYDDSFIGLGLVGLGVGLATGYPYCSPYYGYYDYGYCGGPGFVAAW